MGLIVQKYGGTSVANLDRIRNVAERVLKTYFQGHQVVVVLSAMAGETNRLLNLGHEMTPNPSPREMDVLLATGEQVSVALLAMALNSMGVEARSLLGDQAKIVTDEVYGRARIADVDTARIRQELKKGRIVAVAGFQGRDENGNITTLGRGGSDTTAVALAAALKADVCEIYTDVAGVFTTDPNIVPTARKLDKISYDEMLEMASLGAKVLEIRSVEVAKKFNVPIHVRSSFSHEEGTQVINKDASMEKVVVSGVAYNKNQARVTIKNVPDQPGIAAQIFGPISDAGIIVDVIIQNTAQNSLTDVTCTVPRPDLDRTLELARATAERIGAQEVVGDPTLAKVGIIGVGMQNHAGVASKMFRCLAEHNINIILITTSEIKVSVIIDERYTELAVRALHEAFNLDKPPVEE
ncbi:MAG: aspartate kinase [Deltaproteobacteria bacterium]|nr:aspartate kinase [Deltaproteobacteria bacterium]